VNLEAYATKAELAGEVEGLEAADKALSDQLGSHTHTSYLAKTAQAADSALLDGRAASGFVDTINAQNIGGNKTFAISPTVPVKTEAAGNNSTRIATEAQVFQKLDKNASVADSLKLGGLEAADFLQLAGIQTITGNKVFLISPTMPVKTEAAGNNSTRVATEAQVFQKLDKTAQAADSAMLGGIESADYMRLAGTQTVTGNKLFNISPTVPAKSTDAGNNQGAIATEAQVFKKINKSAFVVSGSAGARRLDITTT
jgi:hypothetical protein